jgi:hypothetical protein
MKRRAALLLFIVLSCQVRLALAVTPTPVPTSTPVPFITPTSQYQGLRPTPTAIVLSAATPIISLPSGENGQIADSMINGYRMANLGNAMDIILFFVFAGIVISIILDLADSAGGGA